MRVLAIGASGFIGPHVVRILIDEGHEVAVFHRTPAALGMPADVREIFADRDRPGETRVEIDRFAPDVVLDLILYSEQQARELMRMLPGRASRLVALSSADVYRNYDGLRGKSTAPPDPVPLCEEAPLRETRYPYRGQDLPFAYANEYEKIVVEQIVMSEPDLPATVLRLPAVYGPGDRQHRLRPYLRRMTDASTRILLDERQADWRWTRGFVGNVAAAVALAVTDPRSAGSVYNVGDHPTLSELQWVEHIARASGWEGEAVAVPASDLPAHLRQPLDWRYDLWTDSSAIRTSIGYTEPVALDEALRRSVEWELLTPETP